MEARFNEKVREFQALIEETRDPRVRSALEAEMYEYMILSAPFIR